MRELLLHVGTGKTGTTTLQETFYKLYKHGCLADVVYPNVNFKKHHNEATCLFLPHERIRRDIKSKYSSEDESYKEFLTRLEGGYVKALTQGQKTIVSGEYFSALNQQEVSLLKTFLTEQCGFDAVRVVLYFREPSSLYLSQVQQRIKASSKFNPPENFKFPYETIANNWRTSFSDVRVREFAREKLAGNDIVTDFAEQVADFLGVRVSPKAIQKYSTTTNESLSAESMYLIQRFRSQLYADKDNVFDDKSKKLISLLSNLDGSLLTTKPKLKESVKQIVDFRNRETYFKALGKPVPATDSPVKPKTRANKDKQFVDSILDVSEAFYSNADSLLFQALNKLL